jgi:hypothetical protein
VHVAIGVLAVAAGGLGLRALSRTDVATFRTLRWLAAGSLLALVVVAGTAPSARLLSAPALGIATLLAGLLLHGMKLLRSRPARGALLAASILGAHGLLGAYFAWSDAAGVTQRFEALRQWALRAEIPRRARHIDVVAVSTSDFATGPNLPWARWFFGLELPRSYRLLSGAQQAHDLLRVDDHTLELAVLSADVGGAFTGSTYRGRDEPLRAGQRIVVGDMRVELVSVEQGNPQLVRVSFGRKLEDPSLLFLHAYPDGLRRLVLPAVGESLRLPRAALPWER